MAFETSIAIGIDSRGARRGASEVNRALDSVGNRARRTINQMGGAFENLRRQMFSLRSAFIGLGAAISFGAIMREFAAFDRGLIGVSKTTDIVGIELQMMGRRIQDISRRVPVATKELLEIAQAAGQLGVKGVDNITRFAETVGKLGLASNLAGEEAATSLARILTVTGTARRDVDRLGSTIVRLGNNFAATEAEIAAVATRVAQSTAQFAVSAADVAGIATAMRAVGVEAEAGGTVVGRAFQAINDAVRGGGEELKSLERIVGQSGDQIRRTFQTSSVQAFRDFMEGLGRIQQSGGDVAAALKSLDLEGVRVIGVLGTLATRADVLRDALDQANEEWRDNTALNKEALAASKSFSAQMRLVINALDETAVIIGKELGPALIDGAKRFREFVIEAKTAGAIKDVAEDLGDALAFVARNADLAVVALSALLGLRLGAAFGPWGAAIGLVVGALAGYVMQADAATDATTRHQSVLREIDSLTRRANESTGERAVQLRKQAEAERAAAIAAEERLISEQRAFQERTIANQGLDRGLVDAVRAGRLDPATARSRSGAGLPEQTQQALAAIQTLDQAIAEANARILELREGVDLTGEDLAAFANSADGAADSVSKAADSTRKMTLSGGEFAKDRRDLAKALGTEIGQLKSLLQAHKINEKAIEDTTRAIKVDNQLREVGLQLGDKEAAQLEEMLFDRERLLEVIEDSTEAREKEARAAEQAAEKQIAAQKRATEEFERRVRESADSIVEFGTDAFDRILEGGKGTFRELGEEIVAIMRRTFARIAAEAIIRPIVTPVIQGVLGGVTQGAASQVLARGLFGGGGAGPAGGGFDLGLPPIGSFFPETFSSITSSIDTFGASLGFGVGASTAPTLAFSSGFGPGASAIFDAPAFASTGLAPAGSLTAASLSSILGAAGIGAFGGGLLASLVGGNQMGGTIGGGLGAGIGFAVGGPVGGLIGGLGGSLLGALGFGKKSSVGPGGGASIGFDPATGSFRFRGMGGDNGFNPGPVRAAVLDLADQLNRFGKELGGTGRILSGPGNVQLEFPAQAPVTSIISGLGNRTFGQDSSAALNDLLLRSIKASTFEGVAEEIATAIKHSAATTLEDLSSDIEFAAALADINFDDIVEPDRLTRAEQALAAINTQFDQMAERAAALGIGLDKLDAARDRAIVALTEGFDEAIRLQIMAFTDPVHGQLEALVAAQKDRLREAEALGADLVAVERLNMLERQRVMEQAFGDMKRLLDELRFGDLGGASPGTRLAGARAAFDAAEKTVAAGGVVQDLDRIVREFVESSRQFFASGAGFQAARNRAIDLVAGIVGEGGGAAAEAIERLKDVISGLHTAPLDRPGGRVDPDLAITNAPGFAHGGEFIVGGRAGIDSNLVPLRLTRGERVSVTSRNDGDTLIDELRAAKRQQMRSSEAHLLRLEAQEALSAEMANEMAQMRRHLAGIERATRGGNS